MRYVWPFTHGGVLLGFWAVLQMMMVLVRVMSASTGGERCFVTVVHVEVLQVRNLMSSIKVAVDFVSPHNIGLCLHMAREMRAQRNAETPLSEVYALDQDFEHQDSLQAENILVYGALAMYQQVKDGASLQG